MKTIRVTFMLISISFIISGCCYRVSCSPCLGPPSIASIGTSIIEFDTTTNNFTLNDLDTILLYSTSIQADLKTPTDTFFNTLNDPKISGTQVKYNAVISDKHKNKFIKINNLETIIIEEGKGCCGCDKEAASSININDTSYLINQLPVKIRK